MKKKVIKSNRSKFKAYAEGEEGKITLNVANMMFGKDKVCLLSYDKTNIILKIPISQFNAREVAKIIQQGRTIIKGAKK